MDLFTSQLRTSGSGSEMSMSASREGPVAAAIECNTRQWGREDGGCESVGRARVMNVNDPFADLCRPVHTCVRPLSTASGFYSTV
jgi:hypothetical protein